jgi:hypothetical protein
MERVEDPLGEKDLWFSRNRMGQGLVCLLSEKFHEVKIR